MPIRSVWTPANLPFIAELPYFRFDVFTAVGNKTVLRQTSALWCGDVCVDRELPEVRGKLMSRSAGFNIDLGHFHLSHCTNVLSPKSLVLLMCSALLTVKPWRHEEWQPSTRLVRIALTGLVMRICFYAYLIRHEGVCLCLCMFIIYVYVVHLFNF